MVASRIKNTNGNISSLLKVQHSKCRWVWLTLAESADIYRTWKFFLFFSRIDSLFDNMEYPASESSMLEIKQDGGILQKIK